MKKFLASLLVLVMAIALVPQGLFTIDVHAATSGNFTYTVSNGKATITDFPTDYTGALTIPSTLGGYPVTSIGSSAFYNCTGLTSVTIPDSVTSISSYAFDGCSGLTSVSIPNSVTYIGYSAFDECTGLTSVYITDLAAWCSIDFGTFTSNPLYYANDLYVNNQKTTDLIIPDLVTSISSYAFNGCTGLTSVSIPDSVTSISSYAFDGCSGLTSVSIPNSVTYIGYSAFDECTGLTSVSIPNSVTSIGGYAFRGCSGLTSVSIPDSVTSISSYAFNGCTGLTSVSIPDSVTSISSSAFANCTGLTSVSIPDSVTSISSSAFANCTGLTSITIPNSVTYIGDFAFDDCDSLTSVSIPDSVTSIGGYVFHGCSGLTSVTIPDSVTSIGEWAFAHCDITTLNIPGSVYTIGEYAFYGSDRLTNITVDITNTAYCSIDDVLFNKDQTILIQYPAGKITTKYSIPNSVTTIELQAFNDCKLTSVSIPKSVKSIGNSAFANCDYLKSILYSGNETDRAAMTINYGNDDLLNATWNYNFCGEGNHTYTNGCDMDCNTCQWPRIGEHTYDNSLDKDCNLCSHARTFEEFPIVGISAEMKPIIEKTGGIMDVDPDGNEWYYYHVYNANTYTITMADSLTFSGQSSEIYELTGQYPQLSNSQSYINQWGIGEHTVTLSFGDITSEATVAIIENPIQSITVEPITVVEGTNCNPESTEDDGELKVWLQYNIYRQSPKLTLIMKDGTSFTGSREAIYAKYGVFPSYSDKQSYDNPWGVGTHAMTVSIGDVTGTVPYIITESPIASISAAPISIYEDIYEYSRIIAGRGLGSQKAYYYYDEIIPIMVTYKNGTSITGTREEIYHATGIELTCFDNQNSSPWEPGPHKATVSLGHLSCEVDITLAPNPVESIELVDIPRTEFADGEQFDLSGSVLRVHFHDGTSEDISIPNFSYMDSVYYYCNKLQAAGRLFTNINVNGEPVYSLSYLGKNTDEYSYSKTDHSIQSVSAVEENENLFITITYDDNTLITLQALRFVPRMGDSCSCGNHAIMYGDLYTDKGVYFAGFIPGCDGSLCVEIDYVPSNVLPDGSAWFNMYNDKYISRGGANFAFLAILLDHYNGKITAENIDNIITYTGTFEDVALKDGGFFNGQSLREAIMKVFAVDSVDLSLSTLYDSKNDRYPATGFGGEAGIHFTPSLVYENGYWEMCYPTGTDHINSYIHYDDDGRILRFSYREPVVSYGDASGDSMIDSRDLVLIRKYMANFDYDKNASPIEVTSGADVTGDGVIDAKDLVLLRKYFANYDYDTGSSSVVLGPQN